MRTMFLSLAAGLAGLALTGAADAHPSHHAPLHRHAPVRRHVGAYYKSHAVHFKGGYYFPGRDHHHWARTVWDARFHRYNYWDADLSVWFYWYAPGNCYYPVSFCP